MKFGSKLESFLIKEWADKYISYKTLNRLLKGAYRFKNRNRSDEDSEDIRLHSMLFSLDGQYSQADELQELGKFDSSINESLVDTERTRIEPESEPISVKIVPSESKVTFSDQKKDHETTPDNKGGLLAKTHRRDDAEQVMRILADAFEETGHLDFGEMSEIKKRLSETIVDSAAKMELKLENMNDYVSKRMKSTKEFKPESLDPECSELEQDYFSHHEPIRTHSDYYLSRYKSRRKTPRRKFLGNLSMFRKVGFTRWDSDPFESKRKYKPKLGSADCLACFDKMLRDDIRKVIMHYTSEMEYITLLTKYLRKDIVNRLAEPDESYIKLVQRAITALWESSDKLMSYLNTNILAVYKLLKKKDKLMGTNDLVELYPTYKEIFLSVDTFNETNKAITSLYNLISEPRKVEFAKIKESVEKSMEYRFMIPYYLPYLLGLCTMLFLVCCVLCSSNFGLEVNYRLFLAQLPIFRLFILFAMIWFAIGWSQNYLETYGVNYQFLLELSNNYFVSERDFYFFGALQMFTTLLIFGVFLLDVKLSAFGNHNMHYLYPVSLIVSSVAVLLLPSRSFKLKLRRRMLLAVLRSFSSPVCVGPPVSLSDTILADVYTSLTRPFVDFLYIFSYFIFGVPQKVWKMHPDLANWAVPVVMILPFCLRFLQCLRRYIEVQLPFHIGNMIKYMSGIVCVVIASIKWTMLSSGQRMTLIAVSYFIATLYNFLWDYFMDWGLSVPANIFQRRNNRRMFSKNAYYVACVFNLLCRFTWALTVSPFKFTEDYDLSLNIVILIISMVEIFRRVVWVVFRLETEHLLNSYKHRTALWVPKLYKCKSVIVKELTLLNKRPDV